MPTICILYYSKSGNTKAVAEEFKLALETAIEAKKRDVQVELCPAQDLVATGAALPFGPLKDKDAFIFGSPDFFSDVAGYLKIFFDDWWETRATFKNRPAAGFVSHGGVGKAKKALERLCTSFNFDYIKPTISVKGKPDQKAIKQIKQCAEQLLALVK
jgi:multimeric flavodoxin WrbA